MRTTITTGNFKLEVEGELNAAQQEAILESGLTYVLQRDGLSKGWKDVLPEKDAKRNSLEFSQDAGDKLAGAVEKALEPYGTFVVSASQHVPTEGAAEPGKMATAMWEQVKANPDLFNLEKLGISDISNEEQGVAACRTFLGTLRATKKA